jgi:hypothetical protein
MIEASPIKGKKTGLWLYFLIPGTPSWLSFREWTCLALLTAHLYDSSYPWEQESLLGQNHPQAPKVSNQLSLSVVVLSTSMFLLRKN